MSDTIILIPCRMASSRLPGKPLADIHGRPMIMHVVDRAVEAGIGTPVVACEDREVYEAVIANGAAAVMTSDHHQSGSDRIWEALQMIDPKGKFDKIVNVQGDLPTIDPVAINASLGPLENPAVGIATLASVIRSDEERNNPNVVKVIGSPTSDYTLRALYFTRATAPWGEGPLYHHIGHYAYRRSALERFVSLAPSMLEKRESLEQLRALEAGMRVDVTLVDTVPLGVDTPADLERARVALNPARR